MDRILKIAKREYIESVKSKTFIISVLFAPVFFGLVIFFTGRMSRIGKEKLPPLRVAFTDLSGKLSEQITTSFAEHKSTEASRQFEIEPAKADVNDFEKIADEQKEQSARQARWMSMLSSTRTLSQEKVLTRTLPQEKVLFGFIHTKQRLPTWMHFGQSKGYSSQAIREYRYKIFNIDRSLLDKLGRFQPSR